MGQNQQEDHNKDISDVLGLGLLTLALLQLFSRLPAFSRLAAGRSENHLVCRLDGVVHS